MKELENYKNLIYTCKHLPFNIATEAKLQYTFIASKYNSKTQCYCSFSKIKHFFSPEITFAVQAPCFYPSTQQLLVLQRQFWLAFQIPEVVIPQIPVAWVPAVTRELHLFINKNIKVISNRIPYKTSDQPQNRKQTEIWPDSMLYSTAINIICSALHFYWHII